MDRAGSIDVLVVDDSDFFLDVTADKLAEHGFETRTATDADGALSALEHRGVDCVVSDYQMPTMDGLELYERVDERFGVPFVLLTGEGDEAVASEAISAGVDDYLRKEAVVDAEQFELLANRIENVVSQHRTSRKYERVLDNTPDEIAEVGTDGEILAVNDAITTALNVDHRDLIGEQLSDIFPREVAANRLEQGRRALTAGSAVTFQDNIGVRHFHNIAVPLVEGSGHETIQFISREITQQKHHERELETKTEELAVINRIVRHDINNDVQLLMAWADGVATSVDEDGVEYVQRIQDTCDHIAELTAIARDFVESLEDEESVDMEPVALDDVLESEVEKKRDTFPDATIRVDGDLLPVSVRANELLASVFGNLLSNAVRHNDASEPTVEVRAETDASTARVVVADDGPGVPGDRRDEIFGKGEMGPESPGTGIGLYLVHTLVEQYGGSVRVEDADLGGAQFVVELPIHERTAHDGESVFGSS
jgi:PAS domain S-box-containing protein